MPIESLRIKNFKAFRQAEMRQMPGLCLVVGANGAGKSTLASVFHFLRIALTSDLTTALARVGGTFEQVRSAGVTGDIEIGIRYHHGETLCDYEIMVGWSNGRALVTKETLSTWATPQDEPTQILAFMKAHGRIFGKSQQSTEMHLKNQDLLALKGYSQFADNPAAAALGSLIEDLHWSWVLPEAALRSGVTGPNDRLDPIGGNLAQVVQHLATHHPDAFARLNASLARRIPALAGVQPVPQPGGSVALRFRDGSFVEPFTAQQMSDGTLKMLQYLVLMHQPHQYGVLLLDEPEHHLYHTLQRELVEELRAYAQRGSQVILCTHSPDLLNAARVDEVFWLVKEQGSSRIVRAADDPQVVAYMSDGDRMGQLWKQGVFPGVDPR